MMEPTAPSVPMVAVFVMVVFWALAFLCCGLVCFCCFSFCFCVDRYAYLTRGCAFLSDARFCFFVMPAILYRLLYETSVSFFSFSFTHRTEPLSIIGHIRRKKNLPTAIRQNGRGYSGGILVADYNQSPKRGVDCGICAPAFLEWYLEMK